MSKGELSGIITKDKYDAVLFDLDGVLTQTAKVHAACWKKMFDDFLKRYAESEGKPFEPFDIATDYHRYVDGKLRYDGVESFLESRGIHLPYGDPGEPGNYETICGLGNLKDAMVKEHIRSGAVEVYENGIAFVRQLNERGIKTAVVSASKNCEAILNAVGIADLFDVRVDGYVADSLNLAGKPAPDTFLEAARKLGAPPERAVVVEDAIVGVQAGRNGGFGLVVGVARKKNVEELKENGADIAIEDLGKLLA